MAISEIQRLQHIFKELPSGQKQTLLAFAEFLYARFEKNSASSSTIPKLLPRSPDESVIGAIKRLSQSYPMLDKATMLDKTSALMTEHILQGRDKVDVIDELETVFARHYEKFTYEKTI
ncbi:Crp/Fnr family transcriptional regulator [Candidatus Parabeggiatoa sp. HSG14]|uniref:Crp/Fnr family transcriptional regulator n=1 Tax=Candidatus Parabeggiatoa sp. HSG14 TaxID=3055593 RepID=UPI0025A838DC|nr:Crp/Fnr family transcriptional regulator [Thiotrichales bacterium HSG14]